MKLLTSKAIQGYRDYTKRTIAYAKYKVGSTYHKTKIESVDVTEEGIVEVRFKIEAATQVPLLLRKSNCMTLNNDLWLSKQEFLEMNSVAELYYVCQLEISERELKNNARTCELERSCGSVSRKVEEQVLAEGLCNIHHLREK